MSGRTHDYYCTACQEWWSPFDFDTCPSGCPEKASFYDLNLEAEQPIPGTDGTTLADLHRREMNEAA